MIQINHFYFQINPVLYELQAERTFILKLFKVLKQQFKLL